MEKYLKNGTQALNQKLQISKNQLEISKTERNSLAAKLDRKLNDLDRTKQRLEALQKIRPAFLEEFERLESELKGLFEQYFIRVRCLDALRMQVATRAKSTPQAMIPISRATADASMTFLPDGLIDSDEEIDENDEVDDELKLKSAGRRDLKEESGEQVPGTRLRVRTAGSSRIIFLFFLINKENNSAFSDTR